MIRIIGGEAEHDGIIVIVIMNVAIVIVVLFAMIIFTWSNLGPLGGEAELGGRRGVGRKISWETSACQRSIVMGRMVMVMMIIFMMSVMAVIIMKVMTIITMILMIMIIFMDEEDCKEYV